MKKYIVTAEAWLPSELERDCFWADEAVRLACGGGGESWADPLLKGGAEEFERLAKDSREAYEKLVSALVPVLNRAHSVAFSREVWRRILGPSFKIWVVVAYDAYRRFSASFRPSDFSYKTLPSSNFCMPCDFSESRRLFQHLPFGQEQLFAIYCLAGKIAPGEPLSLSPPQLTDRAASAVAPAPLGAVGKAKRFLQRLRYWRKPRVAVVESWFSLAAFRRLIHGSHGAIQSYYFPLEIEKAAPDFKRRKELFSQMDLPLPEADFFRACLEHGFPTFLLEGFAFVRAQAEEMLDEHPTWKAIVNESFSSSSSASLLLGLACHRGVCHLYNEHNAITHIFAGNDLEYFASMADEFWTLGWAPRAPVRGVQQVASLFAFQHERRASDIPLLFVSGVNFVKREAYNAYYATSGEALANRLPFQRAFWGSMLEHPEVLQGLVFRDSPKKYRDLWWHLGREHVLGGAASLIGNFSEGGKESATDLMRRSRLVVSDYFSTSFYEALGMNVPCVLVLDEASYILNDSYLNHFRDLKAVGIVQTDPRQAAAWIASIFKDPEAWWGRPEVKKAAREFFHRDIGDPERAIERYFRLAKAPLVPSSGSAL